LDASTKKAIVIGIVALCACVAGAILIVGRGSGSTGLDAARVGPGRAGTPWWYGGPGGFGSGGAGSGRFGQGGSGSGKPAAPSAPGGSDDSTFEQFRTCLANHGVTLPGPGQGRPSAPSTDLRAAFEACRQYLPSRPFGGDGFGRGDHGGFGRGDDASPGAGSDSGQSGTKTF
jgi:hypothetical protein